MVICSPQRLLKRCRPRQKLSFLEETSCFRQIFTYMYDGFQKSSTILFYIPKWSLTEKRNRIYLEFKWNLREISSMKNDSYRNLMPRGRYDLWVLGARDRFEELCRLWLVGSSGLYLCIHCGNFYTCRLHHKFCT